MNECVAVARLLPPALRGDVRMWGCVGDDLAADKFVGALKELGVDVSLVRHMPHMRTGSASITVEETTGENRIIVIAGANGEMTPGPQEMEANFPRAQDMRGKESRSKELRSKESRMRSSPMVVLQNEFPRPLEVIHWLTQNRPEVVTFYNPSPIRKEWLQKDVLNEVGYLVVNRGEGWALVGESEPDGESAPGEKELVSRMRTEFPHPGFIITLGSKGCVYCLPGSAEYGFVASRHVSHVVDTTGAGDTFLGAIVGQLYQGIPLSQAVEYATIASSLAIQKKGAVEGIPSYEEVGH